MRTFLVALSVSTGVAAGVLAPTPAGAAPVAPAPAAVAPAPAAVAPAPAAVTESTEALAAPLRPCRLDRGWWEHARAVLGLEC